MISVVILTKNDEKTIADTLASVSWCDEIIVIDDLSDDRTVNVAKKSKVKIYTRSLSGDFSSQRNFGLSKATGDWVLFVDSDEIVDSSLHDEIQNVMTSHSRETDGYYVKRKDIMWGRSLSYGETSKTVLLRLGKKDKGIWERPIHEIWNIQGITDTLQNPLYHFPHPTVGQFLTDINTYSSINAKYLFDKGVRVHWWDVIIYPVGKFTLNYFFRLGFLDGTPGIILAFMMSFHSFLTRGKIWELQKKKS